MGFRPIFPASKFGFPDLSSFPTASTSRTPPLGTMKKYAGPIFFVEEMVFYFPPFRYP